MLSQAQVVRIRKELQRAYEGRCSITERQEIRRANGSTGFDNIVICTDEPCQLSYKSKSPTAQGNDIHSPEQQITLFISPTLEVKAGSRIEVTQCGGTTAYKSSGQPAIYPTHQEIVLEIFERWS